MQYIGEIRMFAGNFAPEGWAFCEGQSLAINGNDALFSLIGTTYGGDGESTFNLPNLASRVPVHTGNRPGRENYPLGEMAGQEEVTLNVQQIPQHSHPFIATTAVGTDSKPTNALLAQTSGGILLYRSVQPVNAMSNRMLSPVGGSQPHTNLQPYLCINFIIALDGIFPSQN